MSSGLNERFEVSQVSDKTRTLAAFLRKTLPNEDAIVLDLSPIFE